MRFLDCKTVVYFAYVRHTSARASARSSNGSRKVSECKIRPLRELDAILAFTVRRPRASPRASMTDIRKINDCFAVYEIL